MARLATSISDDLKYWELYRYKTRSTRFNNGSCHINSIWNVLALYLDVMFAVRFWYIPVPYSDLRFRNGWFWNNLFGMVGAKYFAIALMDGIIVYWLYKRLQKTLIDKKWMKETDAL
jgi:hypothetical protein